MTSGAGAGGNGRRGRVSRRLALLALAGLLPGCNLISPEHKDLFVVTPKSTFPAGLPRIRAQLLVDVPLAPAGLDTSRIALSRSPVSLDYFAASEWTDRAPLMVQNVLLESFENSRAITAIDRESIGLRADFVLKTEIRHFEAIYEAPNRPPQVWVRINARLVKMPERTIVDSTTVEGREPAAANDMPRIVMAFDEALGGVMKQLVTWTVSNPALSGPRS